MINQLQARFCGWRSVRATPAPAAVERIILRSEGSAWKQLHVVCVREDERWRRGGNTGHNTWILSNEQRLQDSESLSRSYDYKRGGSSDCLLCSFFLLCSKTKFIVNICRRFILKFPVNAICLFSSLPFDNVSKHVSFVLVKLQCYCHSAGAVHRLPPLWHLIRFTSSQNNKTCFFFFWLDCILIYPLLFVVFFGMLLFYYYYYYYCKL